MNETKTSRPKRKRRLVIGLAALGVLLVFLIASVQVTSSSGFCNACHYMKPFYRSWQESSHRNIACSTCHYPPGLRSKVRAKFEGLVMVGRYWTKLYLKSKPWAEISDQSCLNPGCHDRRLLEGRVQFGKVAFDHKVHFADLKRGKTLRCTSCHSQIVQGKHITVTATTCFICHFKNSPTSPRAATCTLCHPKDILVSSRTSRYDHSLVFDKGFACNKCHTHTLMGDGAVPRDNCFKCHWEQERLERYSETDLMHSTHIKVHKIECDQCHLEIQHKIIKDIKTIADCEACHTGTHQAQKVLFLGEGGHGLAKPTPNVMLDKGMSCKACHMFHEEQAGGLLRASTFTSKEQACESCHGAGFARLLVQWEESTARKLASIKEAFGRAEAEVLRQAGAKKERAQALLRDASFNIDIVDKGKAVHNIAYAQELLSVAFMRLVQALKLSGSSYQPDGTAFQTGRVPTACANCHTGIEDVSVPAFGHVFSHRIHLLKALACAACHSHARKHGELIATKASCAACHHQDPKAACVRCHGLQNTFYAGGTADGLTVPADVMAQAGISCADCHVEEKKNMARPDGGRCAACHEESYRSLMEEWQQDTRARLQALDAALKSKPGQRAGADAQASLDAAARTLELLSSDGSAGVHNYAFISDTLTAIEKLVKSLGEDTAHEQTEIR